MARLLGVLTFVVLAALAFVVGRVTVDQAVPQVPAQTARPTVVAGSGEVGRSSPVVVEFPTSFGPSSVGTVLTGTVTQRAPEFDASPTAIFSGPATIAFVDTIPIVLAEGATPAYREISGSAKGDDVKQLQRWLQSEGFLDGEADGVFGASTRAALRDWEKETGQTVDGVAPLGQFIFTPTFDVMISSDDFVEGGPAKSTVLQIPESVVEPQFNVPASASSEFSEGQPVQVDVDGEVIELVIERIETRRDGDVDTTVAVLSAVEGVMGDAVRGRRLEGAVAVVEPVTGVLLPPAVIQVDGGQSFVLDVNGRRIDIDVIGRDGGIVVVEGIAAGTEVLVGGSSAPSPGDS